MSLHRGGLRMEGTDETHFDTWKKAPITTKLDKRTTNEMELGDIAGNDNQWPKTGLPVIFSSEKTSLFHFSWGVELILRLEHLSTENDTQRSIRSQHGQSLRRLQGTRYCFLVHQRQHACCGQRFAHQYPYSPPSAVKFWLFLRSNSQRWHLLLHVLRPA